jgi:catechol 2,3-dioxygenase-like lactoylglutathione lyase family enzyme
VAAIRYLVTDVPEAVTFFVQHLGFLPGTTAGKAFATVSRGDLELWLSGPDSSAARPMPNGDRPEPGGWNRLVIEVDDLADTVQRMTAAGMRFRNDIVTGPGGKQVLVEDPSGNPVELFQPAMKTA